MRLTTAGLASLALIALLVIPLSGCDKKKQQTVPETRAEAGYGGQASSPQTIVIFTPY